MKRTGIEKTMGHWIDRLESEKIPFLNYILTFFFAVFVRDFFESFSRHMNYLDFPSSILALDLLHFMLSYLFLAILLIGLLAVIMREPIARVSRVILAGFLVLWICPLVDLIDSGHSGVNLYYLQPGMGIKRLGKLFLMFFGDYQGVSYGLKAEIAIVLGLVYSYCRIKKSSVMRSLSAAILTYTVIFCWGASPYFIAWAASIAGMSYVFSSELMACFYLIVLPPAALLLGWLWVPVIMRTLLQDMRCLRILHYQLMLILGFVLALNYYQIGLTSQMRADPVIVANLILAVYSIFFACLFSIIINNTVDIEIDRISNADRPLVKGKIAEKTYRQTGYGCFGLALFYAAMVDAKAFLIMTVFMGLYYLYSSWPIRFKRVPVLSKFAISINSLALVILGYVIGLPSLYGFPFVLYPIFLIGFTLAANFIDLKDVKGDRANGISTLPVLLGVQAAKKIIGIAFAATYLSFYLLIKNKMMIPVIAIGAFFQYYLINRDDYHDTWVMMFHDLSIIVLIIYLIQLGGSL